MHLIQRYSLSTGLKINNPSISEQFFPISADKFVCFHTSAKDNLRDYDYWNEVKFILDPILNKYGYKTIQIGFGKDPTANCDIDLRDKTSIRQMAYIVKKCNLFLGVDSFPAHLAGFFKRKMVSIYSNSFMECVRPYWGEREDQILIETHRADKEKPSFSFNENPKTVNRIKPEEIAIAALKLLNLPSEKINFKTINIGARYKQECIEVILSNEKCNLISNFMNVRMDINHDEQALYHILVNNNAEVTLTKPIDDELLFSKKITAINYVTEEFDIEFVKKIKKSGVNHTLLCTSKEKLAQQRFNLFDFTIHLFEINEIIKTNKEKLPNLDLEKTKVQSNKKIICGNKVYETCYDFNNRRNEDDFFLDLDWYYLYNNQHE
jgi:hypothetical protein